MVVVLRWEMEVRMSSGVVARLVGDCGGGAQVMSAVEMARRRKIGRCMLRF